MDTGKSLLQWLERPSSEHGLFVLNPSSHCWERHSYEHLAAEARRIARGLSTFGVGPGATVVLMVPPGAEMIAGLFGVLAAGAAVSMISPPSRVESTAALHARLRHTVRCTLAPVLLCAASLTASVERADAGTPTCSIGDMATAGDALRDDLPIGRAELALVQFTSGSTGPMRGVGVPWPALEANVASIRQWLHWTDEDAAAFWVPSYHDMGLIGGVFAPLTSGGDLWQMSPEQFVRRPIDYIRCFGEGHACLTALPAFGLDFITRRMRPDDLDGMDFSGMKAFVVGAEPIAPNTLQRFEALLKPRGLPSGAVLPAYGMAEATLAITAVPLGRPWVARAPQSGSPVCVGCGVPVDGVDVAVIDEVGTHLDDGIIGEIVCGGSSLARGYVADDEAASTTFVRGQLRTGDAGFLCEGELFVVGRFGDSIKVRGRPVFAETLEIALQDLGYARQDNVVLLGMHEGDPLVIWISTLETQDDDAAVLLLTRMVEGAAIRRIVTRAGMVLRTSSGKPRRRALWTQFIQPNEQTFDAAAAPNGLSANTIKPSQRW